MVKEIDKTNPKNLVEGDTFALKIENNEEYKGQYFILIYTHIPYWTMFKDKLRFRVKITLNGTIPKTKEEIEQLEYVKIMNTTIEEEEANFNHTININPDKYGYIYSYIYSIMQTKKLYGFEYIGNYNLSSPFNEYLPESDGCAGGSSLFEKIEEYLIDCYESWNLQKCKLYTPEGNKQGRKNALYNAWVTKTSREVFRKVEKEGKVREWLISMGIDPDEEPKEEDTLTYVGSSEENIENFEEK